MFSSQVMVHQKGKSREKEFGVHHAHSQEKGNECLVFFSIYTAQDLSYVTVLPTMATLAHPIIIRIASECGCQCRREPKAKPLGSCFGARLAQIQNKWQTLKNHEAH